MTLTIRTASTDDDVDLATIAAIANATSPEDPTSVEEMRWADATYPGEERFIAELDGRPIGAATVGRIWVHPPEYGALWATVDVLPDARGRGAGAALLSATARVAKEGGKRQLHVPVAADRADAVAFLERRGFVEFERAHAVRLELAGHGPVAVDVPNGIELTDLATRPELVEGVHAVALEAFLDIPGGDKPMTAGDVAEFRARDVDRPGIPAGGFVIAIERATDQVVGYAALLDKPGSAGIAFHDMTAVLRTWRRRGLATALKLRTISWATDHGYTALETGSDEDNLAMQAVNRRLGYRPMTDLLTMRGSVDAAMMTR
ncbi:MAG: GNAT family N-acetyltransferase [Chloroflexi bacterium]|nr:GNAT family N-acetyltransferase [Chloroflexota bacterium]